LPRGKRVGTTKQKERDAERAREVALGLKVVDIEELKISRAQVLAGQGRTIDEILANL
jgi:hypothetical protein